MSREETGMMSKLGYKSQWFVWSHCCSCPGVHVLLCIRFTANTMCCELIATPSLFASFGAFYLALFLGWRLHLTIFQHPRHLLKYTIGTSVLGVVLQNLSSRN